MDSNNSKIKRVTRERAERTQITKKRSISLSLVTVTANDDAKIPPTNECPAAQRIPRPAVKPSLRNFGGPCCQKPAAANRDAKPRGPSERSDTTWKAEWKQFQPQSFDDELKQ